MEEDFDQWHKLEPKKWRIFKKQKLKKWLEPYTLSENDLKEPDGYFVNLLNYYREKAKTEQISPYLLKDSPKRKGGLRGQKWFFEMLMDLGVPCDSEFKTERNRYDIFQRDLRATFEAKTMTFEKSVVNIKEGAWIQQPSLYVVVVKACDKDYRTFQFVGWLYGHEVYTLDYVPKYEDHPAHFYAHLSELIGPRKMLKMLLKFSKANPY